MSLQEIELEQVETPALPILFAMQAERMSLSAKSLRDVEAWAAAYAGMLEAGNVSVDDLLKADAAMIRANHRAGEALQSFAISLSCHGVA